jgi:peptidyl-prolyl cis-trans isomerase B (cyclophilin B)
VGYRRYAGQVAQPGVTVQIETSFGPILVELDAERAPKTVANFLRYVDEGHYDGTIFHRVIPHFMAQGGGYDAKLVKKSVHEPVENEAHNGLKNLRATVAMARTSEPNSATSQFFINLADNAFLDHKGKAASEIGYTVFGKVTAGMEVAERIEGVATGAQGPFAKDAPLEAVVIRSIKRA